MKILRIAMDGEEFPNYTFSEAFKTVFEEVTTIWWQQEGDINQKVIDEVTNNKYDAVFMQLQQDGVINDAAAKAINENSIGFNWTGDVRKDIGWYVRMGNYFVTCFTNMHDVERMRGFGYRAEYLQTGYDDKYYYPEKSECHNNIVFCANYYDNQDYPLTNLRRDLVIALKREFKDKFNLYGGSWRNCGIFAEYEKVNNTQEAEIYRTCAIAINCSHFDHSRYSSDRLFREMACGAFVLSHRYKDYELDFEERKHLVTWDTIPDLIKKCYYYLEHEAERKVIAKNAADISVKAKWAERLMELKMLIYKYKGISEPILPIVKQKNILPEVNLMPTPNKVEDTVYAKIENHGVDVFYGAHKLPFGSPKFRKYIEDYFK